MKQAATLLLPFAFIVPGTSSSAHSSLSLAEGPSTSINSAISPSQATQPLSNNQQLAEQSLYQLMAAEMALDREQPEIALANYIAAAKETQDPAIAARATQIALSIASLEQAVEPAVIWAKADAKNLEAQITTAALYIRINQADKAVPYLKNAQTLNGEEAFQYFLILYKQLQKQEENAGVLHALQLLSAEPTKEQSAKLALAEIHLFQGENSQAFTLSQQAFNADPQSVIATQIYSEALLRQEGKATAKTFLTNVINKDPHNKALRHYYAQFLLDSGDAKEAEEQIAQLLQDPTLNSQELLQYARICMQAQWFTLAKKALHKASQFPESKDLAHYFLARVAEMQNQDKVAIEWFKQVLTGPFHVLSQIRASVLLGEHKQYEEGLALLNHTQANDLGDSKQIALAKVDLLNKFQRYQESLNLLNEQIKNIPDDIELLYARSVMAEKLNQIELATADLKTILNIQPNHLDALNTLGYLLATHTTHYQEAELYLKKALQLSPDNAAILDSLGWLYYKTGDFSAALTNLQKAAKLAPDAEIAAHLGEVLWKMKDFEGAKKVWKSALEQNPKHENVLNVMQRLMQK